MAVLDIYNENYFFSILNLIMCGIASYVLLLQKNKLNLSILLISSTISAFLHLFMMIFIQPHFILIYDQTLNFPFNFFVIVYNPIAVSIIYLFSSKMEKFDNFPIKRRSWRVIQLENKYNNRFFIKNSDYIFFVSIGVVWGLIKVFYWSNWLAFLSVSGWAVAACITVVFHHNSWISSYLSSIIITLVWLMLLDGLPSSGGVNMTVWVYHIIIIAIAFYVFAIKRDIQWEKMIIAEIWVRIYAFFITKVDTRYLPHLNETTFFLLFEIMILASIAFFLPINKRFNHKI